MERPPMETAMSTHVVVGIVMKHLKKRDLLNCRKVSKCWNMAASSVLRQRPTVVKSISMQKTLTELGKCMKQSSGFPLAGLKFDEPWKFRTAGATGFFKNYGARVTRLHLGTSLKTRLEDIAPVLKQLPSLSTLELNRTYSSPPRAQLLDSTAGQEAGRILNLPSLRTLRISSEVNAEVLRQLVAAASPVLRIECLKITYRTLKALQFVGKLQAVSVLNVDGHYDEDGEDCAFKVMSAEWPALTKLDFSVGGSLTGLKKLLFSSQHTLKELRLHDICPSECPVLAKLTTLSVEMLSSRVFQGRYGHKFPALKELTLGIGLNPSTANLSDGLLIVPSLQKIDLRGYVDKAGIEGLARSFPNVTKIRVDHKSYDFERSWDRDPTDIWSVGAFKFLEKLRIWNYIVRPPNKIFHKLKKYKGCVNFRKFRLMNMDSFLTGIPIATCENLRKHPQQNLMGSPFNEILRDSTGLLQLKNLKELVVCVKLEDGLETLPEEPSFISMVSVWYATQMMPNLEAKFVHEYHSPAWGEERRDKAVKVLNTAFKHVQPYLKLEPFFY